MKNDKMKNQYRVNEQIRVREVRIVSDGESTVMPTRHALDMAREQGVDLVEISPNAQPPVCRLIDYSKFPVSKTQLLAHEPLSARVCRRLH
uniref:translation initiation factor IF-3 n=1 Tax=Prevotella sp. TaxID=59823 RepID=UPI004025B540